MKRCRVCNELVPLSLFSINNATSDGLQTKCKICDNEYQRTRRNTQAYKKKSIEYSKQYREERKDNFEWRMKQLISAAKARARTKGLDFDITLEYILEIYPDDSFCPVFGFEMTFGDASERDTSPSIDRIDSELGYTRDNVQIISWKANRMKCDFTLNDLKALIAFMEV